ncbi:MAG: hypothetical protein EXS68_01950 [Candidatus Ryanbacteria bacterium]|nr:hypothetical protein [Candidatus Ryanbacteria bacterium]
MFEYFIEHGVVRRIDKPSWWNWTNPQSIEGQAHNNFVDAKAEVDFGTFWLAFEKKRNSFFRRMFWRHTFLVLYVAPEKKMELRALIARHLKEKPENILDQIGNKYLFN